MLALTFVQEDYGSAEQQLPPILRAVPLSLPWESATHLYALKTCFVFFPGTRFPAVLHTKFKLFMPICRRAWVVRPFGMGDFPISVIIMNLEINFKWCIQIARILFLCQDEMDVKKGIGPTLWSTAQQLLYVMQMALSMMMLNLKL
jgi:hypothetical protein